LLAEITLIVDKEERRFYSSGEFLTGSASLLRMLRTHTYMIERIKSGVKIDKIVCFSPGSTDLRLLLLQLAQDLAKAFVDMQGGEVPSIDIYAEEIANTPAWETIPGICPADVVSRDMNKYNFHLVNYSRHFHEGTLKIDENTLVLDRSAIWAS
jgi:hypothetical protein